MSILFRLMLAVFGALALGGCSSSPATVTYYEPAQPIIEKKLEVTTHDGSTSYCYSLNYKDSYTIVISEGARGALHTCSAPIYTWTMDVNGRISTVVNKKLDYCLTVPESVVNGKEEWDFVRVLRCDLGNERQQWYLDDEKHFRSAVGGYKMKDYLYGLYVSTKSSAWFDHTLSPSMDDWAKNLSIPRSNYYSTAMNWRNTVQGKEQRYYANYRGDVYVAFRAAEDNSYRVLYDPQTKLLAFQHKLDTNESVAFCMRSMNKAGDRAWQYTRLSSYDECPAVGTKPKSIPEDMRWEMVVTELPEDESQQAKVAFFDHLGNSLNVWSTGGAQGLMFTAPVNLASGYDNVVYESTTEFYVDRALAVRGLFESANEQKRTAYCPARTKDPRQITITAPESEGSLTVVPLDFNFTPAWYARLASIGSMPGGGPLVGSCGACAFEAAEVIREILEQNPDGSPPASSHYFDINNRTQAVSDQFRALFPIQAQALQNIRDERTQTVELLRAVVHQGVIPQEVALALILRSFEILASDVLRVLLPYHQSTPQVSLIGWSDNQAIRDQINQSLQNYPVGSVFYVNHSVFLEGGLTGGHSYPLVYTASGWVVLEVSASTRTGPYFDRFNQHRSATPAEAIFYYLLNRRPYGDGQRYLIDFTEPTNMLLIHSVRPTVLVLHPSISTGNCTGEGRDGRRGTGRRTQERDSIPNTCETSTGATLRCYGSPSSSVSATSRP